MSEISVDLHVEDVEIQNLGDLHADLWDLHVDLWDPGISMWSSRLRDPHVEIRNLGDIHVNLRDLQDLHVDLQDVGDLVWISGSPCGSPGSQRSQRSLCRSPGCWRSPCGSRGYQDLHVDFRDVGDFHVEIRDLCVDFRDVRDLNVEIQDVGDPCTDLQDLCGCLGSPGFHTGLEDFRDLHPTMLDCTTKCFNVAKNLLLLDPKGPYRDHKDAWDL